MIWKSSKSGNINLPYIKGLLYNNIVFTTRITLMTIFFQFYDYNQYTYILHPTVLFCKSSVFSFEFKHVLGENNHILL